MFNQILISIIQIQPRYFLGIFYLSYVGSLGGNILLESIFCGIYFGITDLIKESQMK